MTAYADWGDWIADWGDDDTLTFQQKREGVAAAIRASVPANWTVYASPPATVTVPAVVVGPRAPYSDPSTFSTPALHLRATVLLPVAVGVDALDSIDAALELVRAAVVGADQLNIAWESVAQVGYVDATAGVEHIAGVVNLTII